VNNETKPGTSFSINYIRNLVKIKKKEDENIAKFHWL
jgi:hypothetical protein